MHDFHFPHLNLLTLSSIQRQAYILDVHVRCTTSETFYSVKISVARATQLRRLIVGNAGLTAVDRTNSAEVDSSVNFRFEGDLQQALEELKGLSLFPVVQFKAKQRFIIEKIVERRDVFGQLIEESNLPNVAYKLGGLKIVRC